MDVSHNRICDVRSHSSGVVGPRGAVYLSHQANLSNVGACDSNSCVLELYDVDETCSGPALWMWVMLGLKVPKIPVLALGDVKGTLSRYLGVNAGYTGCCAIKGTDPEQWKCRGGLLQAPKESASDPWTYGSNSDNLRAATHRKVCS